MNPTLEEMLSYYGYATLDEFCKDIGLRSVDALRKLKDMYEEDILYEESLQEVYA